MVRGRVICLLNLHGPISRSLLRSAAPIIHGDTDEFLRIWEVINYFMAIAVVIALAASFMHKRAMESKADAVDVILAPRRFSPHKHRRFYSALWLSLWFFWKWFETLFGGGGSDLSSGHQSENREH